VIKKGDPGYLLHHCDRLVHVMHRHEPPVTARPIKIVYEDDELLVIDKPSSIPVSRMREEGGEANFFFQRSYRC
jgi:23S rRNA-/tRNA-specific pseudouridylate synthase